MHTFKYAQFRRMHEAARSDAAKAAVEIGELILTGEIDGVDPDERLKEARQWAIAGASTLDKASADADIAKWIAKLEAKEAKKKAAEELAAMRARERGGSDATP